MGGRFLRERQLTVLLITESVVGAGSPTRYGVLTGRYSWRALVRGIVNVYGKPLISADRLTVPKMLRSSPAIPYFLTYSRNISSWLASGVHPA